MTTEQTIPDGFARHERRSGLTAPWEPIYASTTADAFCLGLFAGKAHVNSRGFVHGGLLSALTDNAMGLSCARLIDDIGGLVTVSLNVDFLGTAFQGQWIEIRATPTRVGKSLSFAEAHVYASDQLCATAKAVFKVQLKTTQPEM